MILSQGWYKSQLHYSPQLSGLKKQFLLPPKVKPNINQ